MQQHIYYIRFALRFADMQIPELVSVFPITISHSSTNFSVVP